MSKVAKMKIRDEVFQKVEILEEVKGEKNKIKFCWAVADTKNANNRVYPQGILEAEIKRLQGVLGAGDVMWGGDGHPQGSPHLLKVGDISHQVTRVWMSGKRAMAEAEIIPTKIGKDLAVVLGHGKVGVSLRGTGSTSPKDGVDYVGADFRCEGVDFVMSPSFQECAAGGLFESAEFPAGKVDSDEETKLAILSKLESANGTMEKMLANAMRTRNILEQKKKGKVVVEKKVEEPEYGKSSELEMRLCGAKENLGPEPRIPLVTDEMRFFSGELVRKLVAEKYDRRR
jgi:hypothetical protein